VCFIVPYLRACRSSVQERKRAPRTRACQLLLEQPATRYAAGDAGGVRPSAPLDRAVSRGGEGVAGLGPVSGATLGWVPPPRAADHDCVQLPGVAGVAAAAAPASSRPPTRAVFPPGVTGDGYRWRACSARSWTGCGCWRWRSSVDWAVWPCFARSCAEDERGSDTYMTCNEVGIGCSCWVGCSSRFLCVRARERTVLLYHSCGLP